ncbi:MAG: HAMP domain-containing histidine kinase [Candidatus Marinimicrobia bacterium]|nr:HAMP domain-containing histidine kinase [Candidatus Neomarinimicrobiota bacterium]
MKIFNQTLHTKIVFWTTSVVGVILLVFSIESVLLIRNKLSEDIDHRLTSEAQEIIQTFGIVDEKMKIIHEFEWQEPHHVTEEDAIYIIYTDENKIERIRSKNYLEKASPLSSLSFETLIATFKTMFIDDKKIRFAVVPIDIEQIHRGWLITGMTFESLNHVQSVIIGVYAIIFPIAMIIAFMGSSIIARKALEPVLNISETVRKIHAQNLDQALPVIESNDEIAHLAETINDLLKRLKESFKTIRQFTANASHELKIPLSIVQAELEQFQKINHDRLDKHSLEKTKIELNRIAKLIDDLSTLAKADTKQINLKKETVWLNDIIYDEIERYRQTAGKKTIQIIPEDLPSVSVQADGHWLHVLTSNLLDNAIKFSPENTTIKIKILLNDPHYFHLVFIDEGPGIQEQEFENITRRFYRVDPTNNEIGSGLGLSIVEWVTDAHGGLLNFKNNFDKGLTVSVTLPK